MLQNGQQHDSSLSTLKTERLLLREFAMTDQGTIARLLNDTLIAANMLRLPHPFTEDDALDFLNWARNPVLRVGNLPYALAPIDGRHLLQADSLIGSASLRIDVGRQSGELSYWIGREYRGKGFATEAARCLIELGLSL